MDLSTQKKMAADVLGCGRNKVYLDPQRQEDIADAITKADIRRLVQEGAIQEKEKQGQSRGRTRKNRRQKKKGRRSGHGSRKGSKQNRKREWMSRIRAQRNLLKELRDQGNLEGHEFRSLYRKAKGGEFKSKKQLKGYMFKEGIIEEDEIE